MNTPIQSNVSALDVAEYFIALANESGSVITNLKLQKLVYYAQAWYLANYSKSLFSEDFQAWVHGPVIPDLYEKFKQSGSAPIASTKKLIEVKGSIDQEISDFLQEVADVYMQFDGYALELMTHQEAPWINARTGCKPDERCAEVISKEAMLSFYGERIKN